MEDDGFTLVTGKKAAKNTIFKKTENGAHINGTYEEIQSAMDNAKEGVWKSGLLGWLDDELEAIIQRSNQKITEILLIGNGHFDGPNQSGAHQLALFIEISESFNAGITFQEPNSSSVEIQWLQNQKLKYPVKIRTELDTNIEIDEDPNKVTLLAMIHGEHNLLNSFLSFNWDRLKKMKNFIFIGNNYGSVAWDISYFKPENQKINEFLEISTALPFPDIYARNFNAFSNTAILSVNEYF